MRGDISISFFKKMATKLLLKSEHFLDRSELYLKIADIREQEKRNIRVARVEEFAESRLEELLREWGFTEESIGIISDQPELLMYSHLESLKTKYAPWL